MKVTFYSRTNKTNFHKKGFALSLVLEVRAFGTRKWAITITAFFLLTDNSPSTQINKVVSHPTLPLTVTAHEDRHIRFFDNNSGKYKQKVQTKSCKLGGSIVEFRCVIK